MPNQIGRYLLSGGVVVAELGLEVPIPDTNSRAWILRPLAAFDSIREVAAEAAQLPREPHERIPTHINGIEDLNERAQAIRSWFRTDPHSQRVTRHMERVRALDLAIQDDAGQAISAWAISVQQFPWSPTPDEMEDAVAVGFSGESPFYIMAAVLEPPFATTARL